MSKLGLLEKTPDKLNIFNKYRYSKDDSLIAYEFLLKQVGYAETTIKKKLKMAEKIHYDFPLLSGLQSHILKNGIIGSGYNKDGTSYLHFLCMVNLIDIKCSDYFKVNPTTLIKIRKWYEPYFEELGITSYLYTVKSVIERNRNRKINKNKIIDKTIKALLYLIMKYHLQNIDDLKQEQWNECLNEIKKISAKLNNILPNTIMGQAFYERGVLEEVSASYFVSFKKKNRSFDDIEEVSPIVDRYISFIKTIFKPYTCLAKIRALDHFFEFAKKRRGFKSLENVTRNLIYDYKIKLKSKGYSSSYNQSEMYGIKSFFEYVEANKEELLEAGYKVQVKRILIDKDFQIKAVKYQPRPIAPEVISLMIEALGKSSNKQFALTFLLMLTTGISLADVLNLKYDCVHKMADGSHIISVYRTKINKYYEAKIRPETIKIVSSLQAFNTQIVPTSHPDGSNAFYLINDRGTHLSNMWFTAKFTTLKKQLSKEHPELSSKIMNSTPHMIRHSFATRMRDNGADIYTLAHLLGHENINTTKKYVKESDKIKQEYIKKLNEKYVCDSIDDISKLTETEKGLQVISDMMNFRNNVSIGICTVNGYKNCPMAYQCVDCIYLCSTLEDVPEMMDMLEGLKNAYDTLIEAGNINAAYLYKKKALRLADKIKKLEERIIDIPNNL